MPDIKPRTHTEPATPVDLTLLESGWLIHALMHANPDYRNWLAAGRPLSGALQDTFERMYKLHEKLSVANTRLMLAGTDKEDRS